MDYQEAIERIRDHKEIHYKNEYPRTTIITEAFETAISAMKELQEYHKTGMIPAEVIRMQHGYAVKMTDLEDYQRIGTLEEVREAVEKQKKKKPSYDGDGYAPDGTFVWDEWICPRCGKRYEVDYDDYDYCPNCGQRILWEE